MIEPRSANRPYRRLLLAGSALGGVLLALLLLMTMREGGGDQGALRSAATQTTTTGPASSARQDQSSLPVVSVPSEGRDPFLPVVAVPRERSAQASQQASSVSPSPAASPSRAASSPVQPVAPAHAVLELKSISRDAAGVLRAQITVDGQPYTAAKGETFSPYGYRLEQLEGNCVEVSAQSARASMCTPSPAP